jgi:hypothetical protein
LKLQTLRINGDYRNYSTEEVDFETLVKHRIEGVTRLRITDVVERCGLRFARRSCYKIARKLLSRLLGLRSDSVHPSVSDFPRIVRYPPSPSNLWNHRVSGKFENNLWGSMSCGQNLEPQRLRTDFPPRSLSSQLPVIKTAHPLAEVMIYFF